MDVFGATPCCSLGSISRKSRYVKHCNSCRIMDGIVHLPFESTPPIPSRYCVKMMGMLRLHPRSEFPGFPSGFSPPKSHTSNSRISVPSPRWTSDELMMPTLSLRDKAWTRTREKSKVEKMESDKFQGKLPPPPLR